MYNFDNGVAPYDSYSESFLAVLDIANAPVAAEAHATIPGQRRFPAGS
jgi:hypothetical protein